MYVCDDEVLQIFRELPDHRGCETCELDEAESQLNVRFPTVYREMMRIDAFRLTSAGIVAPIQQLQELRNEADSLLLDEGYSFRLLPEQVVFFWDDIFAFYFFRAAGEHDTAVMRFNYYSPDDSGEPRVHCNSLTDYFCEKLRRHLKL